MTTFDAAKWATTSVENDNNDPPDPGLYEALLNDGRAFTSQAGKDYVALSWRVAAGPQAGYEWDVLYGFGSDGAMKAMKATLIRVGVDVDAINTLEDLDAAVKAVSGEWYAVEVKQNGEFRNTYVNGKIAPPAVSDVPAPTAEFLAAAAAGSAATDNVPF